MSAVAYPELPNQQGVSVCVPGAYVIGIDTDGDGKLDSTVKLTIEYDPDTYDNTNGYYGTYLDLYLAEFTENLQWYLDNLDYSAFSLYVDQMYGKYVSKTNITKSAAVQQWSPLKACLVSRNTQNLLLKHFKILKQALKIHA